VLRCAPPQRPSIRQRVLIPVNDLNRATAAAVEYALSITDPDRITAVHVVTEDEEESGAVSTLPERWKEWAPALELRVLPSPYREVIAPLLELLDDWQKESHEPITVMLPEVIPHHWYEEPLHNQLPIALKFALLFRPGVVVTSVPVRLRK
jgi:hypothetical protein